MEQSSAARLEAELRPAWARVTAGESRIASTLAVAVAIGLQTAVPERLTLSRSWVLPAIEAVLLVALVVANPVRITRSSPRLRVLSLSLVAVAALANTWSAAALVHQIVTGHHATERATPLLVTGASIWLTNVLVFALWFWELDRGGPADRAAGLRHDRPDFAFTQMTSPDLAPPDWEPGFVDYLFLGFTNATAFSPTDTLPLSPRAKALMVLQSVVALTTAALVIARAVNILQ
ncbi:hypothetical protein [Motilibacter rhizosphaerae]|uniref:hypothetical protein n=1 Tax=Motilibacter rhizosphaerae TaxID=598652 RepID=UPI001E358784|nr:hypothetical protein [Motilibacter rhizosphaerae]